MNFDCDQLKSTKINCLILYRMVAMMTLHVLMMVWHFP